MILGWLLAAVALGGCKDKEQPPAPPEPDSQIQTTELQQQRKVIATVNGTDIYLDQFDARVESQISDVQKQMPDQFKDKFLEELRKKTLGKMIIEQILSDKAEELRITVTDTDVNARISKLNEEKGMSMQDFLELLEAKDMTLTAYKQDLKKRLLLEKVIESELSNMADEQYKEAAVRYIEKLKEDADIVYTTGERVR